MSLILSNVKRSQVPIQKQNPEHPEKDEFGEVRRLINEARATLPGLSTSLPARRNLWGDPIEVPKDGQSSGYRQSLSHSQA